VQHAGAVRGLHGARDLDADAQHLGHGQRLAPVALAERGGAELHDQVGPAVRRDARLVDGEDRGVRAQLGHQVGLGLEHRAHVVVDDLGKHDLHGHLATGHVLLVQEHVGEAAGTEHTDVREAGQVRRR
jgi:hypothetical protein